MKKISLSKCLLTAILLIALFATFAFSGAVHCFADFSDGFIEVFGSGKMEADPNTAQIILSVSTLSSTLRDGQNEIMNTIDCIENSVKEIDENCEVEVYNSITQPVRENGTQEYRLTYWLALKTSCLNCVDALIEKAEECGAINHQNISYELDNFDQLYDEAITIAKNNAFSKAKAINPNINQVDLFEVSIFNYSTDSKIVVEACVRIKYEVNSNNNESENVASTLIDEQTVEENNNDNNLRNLDTKNDIQENTKLDESKTLKKEYESKNSVIENEDENASTIERTSENEIKNENTDLNSTSNSETSNEDMHTYKNTDDLTTNSQNEEVRVVEVEPKVYSSSNFN